MQEGDQSVKFVQKNLNTLKQLINNSNRKRTLSMSSTITTSSDDSSAKQRRLDTDESLIDCDSASKINELLFLQKNLNTLKQLINNSNRKRTLSMSSTITTSSDDSSAKQQRLHTDESLIDCDNMKIFSD
ncbi:unnamed protein product [Adineta ricciae]|uniref:Uncharacterized protein n=1 Tax=Adineta ricciae TaxID=249248 RepID=A0A815VLC9_ADIRI|nr:unnamed protein product [Adineta ricciae]